MENLLLTQDFTSPQTEKSVSGLLPVQFVSPQFVCIVVLKNGRWVDEFLDATNLQINRGRNEVRWLPGQEASLAPPFSNLRSSGNKCTVLQNVRVTLLGLFGALVIIRRPRSTSAPPKVIWRRGNCASLPLRYAPADWTIMQRVKSYRRIR